MTSKDLKNKLVTRVVDSNGEVIYDFTDVIDAIKNKIDTLEKENQDLREERGRFVTATLESYGDNIELKKEIDRLKKELKQTKLNFRNSQTHSKNRYKKLKEKYEKLETANKNNEGLVRENTDLINRNLELQDENQELKEKCKMLEENEEVVLTTLEIAVKENIKLKKALDILKEKLEIQLHQDDEYFPIPMISGSEIFQNLTKEEYKLLKEVLE